MSAQTSYLQACDLYRHGYVLEAADLLGDLVQADPHHLDARHALAVCWTDLGDRAAARVELEFIVQQDPHRFDDVYRLAVLCQATGDLAAAVQLYQRLLAGGSFRDAEQRLAACEALTPRLAPDIAAARSQPMTTAVTSPAVNAVVIGNHPWTPESVQEHVVAGPESLRTVIETARNASRGQLVRSLRQLSRHRLPQALRALRAPAGMLAVAVALTVVQHRLSDEWLSLLGEPTQIRTVLAGLVPFLGALALLGSIAVILWQLLTALLYRVDIYTRGLEVTAGLVPRRRTFIWYANVTQDSVYTRNAWSYLTRTASLELRYDDGSGATREVLTLDGIGTPATVSTTRQYLELRRKPERMAAAGILGG